MKKLLIIFIFLYSNIILFSQDLNFGLKQEDINKLLGQYIPKKDIGIGYGWIEKSFSWGTSEAWNTNGDMMIIEYEKGYSRFYDLENEYRLWLIFDGPAFIITNIEKLSESQFKISIEIRDYCDELNSTVFNEGSIIYNFLNNRTVLLENMSQLNWSILNAQWIKTAGPYININLDDEAEEPQFIEEIEKADNKTNHIATVNNTEDFVELESRKTWYWFFLFILLGIFIFIKIKIIRQNNVNRK